VWRNALRPEGIQAGGDRWSETISTGELSFLHFKCSHQLIADSFRKEVNPQCEGKGGSVSEAIFCQLYHYLPRSGITFQQLLKNLAV